MKLWQQILGHSNILQSLERSLTTDKLAHALLFVGPQGVGKKLVAQAVAQALVCEKGPLACGFCPACARAAHQQHEGILNIEPDGTQIKVDQAKHILEFLSLRSLSRHRVVIVDQAHLLNPQAGNSLLKVIEEPPQNTHFFLIAPSSQSVLKTLRSRSQVVAFSPLATDLLAKRVKAPQWVLQSAQGSFAKLNQLLESDEQEVRQIAVQTLNWYVNDPDFLTHELWREKFKDRSQAQKIFTYWSGLWKDAILYQEGRQQDMVNVDQNDLVTALAKKSRAQILKALTDCLELERGVWQNRDVVLMVEKSYVD